MCLFKIYLNARAFERNQLIAFEMFAFAPLPRCRNVGRALERARVRAGAGTLVGERSSGGRYRPASPVVAGVPRSRRGVFIAWRRWWVVHTALLSVNEFRAGLPLVPWLINKLIYSALAVTRSTGQRGESLFSGLVLFFVITVQVAALSSGSIK